MRAELLFEVVKLLGGVGLVGEGGEGNWFSSSG